MRQVLHEFRISTRGRGFYELTDEVRGLPAYTALQLRVADEVRDRRRINPYSALVRIGAQPQEVAT